MGVRTSWTGSTERLWMWLASQVRHLHLFERNCGFIPFGILGFNYEFNALNPMGKPNELHEAFEKFKAKNGFNFVSLLNGMFPALGPILKIFVSFPFSYLTMNPRLIAWNFQGGWSPAHGGRRSAYRRPYRASTFESKQISRRFCREGWRETDCKGLTQSFGPCEHW